MLVCCRLPFGCGGVVEVGLRRLKSAEGTLRGLWVAADRTFVPLLGNFAYGFPLLTWKKSKQDPFLFYCKQPPTNFEERSIKLRRLDAAIPMRGSFLDHVLGTLGLGFYSHLKQSTKVRIWL